MITAYPEYYKEFSCIASACRHSCCIGWEIDIDPVSAERYRKAEGSLGEKMCRCIDFAAEQPHFILGEDERCPFLDDSNLCEIILAMGEDAISDICADHPRFRTYLSERTETGLGLCCEEAARLILAWDKPMTLVEEGEGEYTADEDYLMDLRDEIFELMNDESMPLLRRMWSVMGLCEASMQPRPMPQWAHFFMGLERLDEAWSDCVLRLGRSSLCEKEIDFFMESHKKPFVNLFNYFVYRHLFSALDDGDIPSKVLFANLSCRIIAVLCMLDPAPHEPQTMIEYARMYSSEIEYSDENLGFIFDELR